MLLNSWDALKMTVKPLLMPGGKKSLIDCCVQVYSYPVNFRVLLMIVNVSLLPLDKYQRNTVNISVSSSLRGYSTIYNAYIASNNHRTLTSVTPEDCAKACNRETGFLCRSFDYNSGSKLCHLSKANHLTVAVTQSDKIKDINYYELSK